MTTQKQGILSATIKDKQDLFKCYMPFVKNGGLFITTPRKYVLGDEVFVLINFLEEKERLPAAGKVVWITPVGAQGSRPPGIGIQFNEGPESENLKAKIESALMGMLNSEKPTYTI